MKNTLITPLFLTVLAVSAGAFPAPVSPETSSPLTEPRRVLREGIAVDLTVEPLAANAGGRLREGDDVRVRVEVTDTHTGTPMPGVFPAAWMDLLPAGREDDPDACKTKVEGFLSGSMLSVPDLDLNVYYVLAMNNDGTISVVDPLFGFGGSKLLTMVFLESPGEDWVMTRDHKRLFVSMPRSGKVAVVDTATWKVTANIETGPTPTRLALQSDERQLWVTYEADGAQTSGVTVIDTRTLEEVGRFETGRGRHHLAFDDRGRHAFVTNELDGTVTVIDARTVADTPTADTAFRQIEIGGQPLSIEFSPIAGSVWIAGQDGSIVGLDAERLAVASRLETASGLAGLYFSPDGRWGFAPNPRSNELYIVDASRGRIVQSGEMEAGPDFVAFSDRMAYVRHRESDLVLMIPLGEIGQEGAPIPVIDIPGGGHPAGQTAMPSSAASIVRTPGATAVLIANPLDQAIYFYKEGMAAPMGHFKNYGRQPRAVVVVDRSLRETRSGVYETTVKMRGPGLYDVAIFLDSPRVIHCFEVQVEPSEERLAEIKRARRLDVSLNASQRSPKVGEPVRLRVEIHDAKTGEPRDGLEDVDVVAFLSPGVWQRRQWARGLGDGVYEVELTPPKTGVYYVFVEILSEGLRSNQSSSLILQTLTPPAAHRSSGQAATLQKAWPGNPLGPH